MVPGHSWTTEFVGDIIGNPIASVGNASKLVADVEIAPAPTPDGIGSVVRVVAPAEAWGRLVGMDNARVRVVGALWTTRSGLIRCTPTVLQAV